MPEKFFEDTLNTPEAEWCSNLTEMWDGPARCTRHKNHQNISATINPSAQLHQEQFEGWVWTDSGRVW